MNDGTTPAPVDDKTNIRTSEANADVLEILVKQGHFVTQLGAFQAAAMLALRKDLSAVEIPSNGGLNYNQGSFKQVIDFLTWYVPTPTPARLLEQLGNAGTSYIGEKVRSGGYTFTEIFEIPQPDAIA
jgi:hypothetical protein